MDNPTSNHQAETSCDWPLYEFVDYPHAITEEERNRPRIRPPHALYYTLGLDKLNQDTPPESPPAPAAGA